MNRILLIALMALASHAWGVEPGDDFFGYANAQWLDATQVPAGKASWGARADIAALTSAQVLQLLEDAKQAPKGSDARKVADFRAAWDVKGGSASLKRIDAIHDKASLTRHLGREMRADVDPNFWGVYDSSHVIGLAVQSGRHGEKTHVAYLLQGGAGLPDEPSVARLLGSEKRAAKVIRFAAALASTHATPEASDDERNADRVWTRADFAREAPGMDWNAFFADAGLARQATFVAWQPSAMKGVASLVATQPVEVWKDYLRVRAMPPSGDAVEATQKYLSPIIGRMYAERYFPPAQKARVQAIAKNVIASLTRQVESAGWMSVESRAAALSKLNAMYFGVGYPEHWDDFSQLVISATDREGNLERIARDNLRRALAKLGKPVDNREWGIAPQWPGAALHFHQNAYNFAAALLQAPKFDPDASDAMNYGAIGAIIGHEATHFIDTLGADYAPDGSRKRWWRDADLACYTAATDPLVRQYAAYRPLPDVAVDGKLGLTENFADLAGLAAAFDAYRRTLGDKAMDKEFVRAQDREFFIGFARSWRVKSSDAALRKQAASDHSPEQFRIATVRNIDAWYDAFDVKPGQRLWLEPSERVRPWQACKPAP